jgi:Cys-tRNA(Pro)/Cys-tRNA(Cys) deacylase
MKTQLPTIVERSALNWETIYLSGGKIGLLLEVSPNALLHTLGATFESIAKE